ncbi:glycogen recognition site of AMP-activated kinase [Hirsutella rhossiliensis]|uniref:Glycogen recognition site of AMP-activated kinase n=1 Tax=Hirsutella rhossiliensis TaxID=111463 RepID=A0A9P8N657_9HYPO|nr:glycogen recognition site of AMP-activated kinase [Hirsutella rhossiliensis]KAH0967479.1 glycogen recognition site of AMP-activated kinase [Hirsutella rhossiliensis]
MGSYTFKWEHDAEEAFVTGTFDNWRKSIRLEKKNGVFQKTVPLDDTTDKIYYKFVVDHNWTVNSSCPHEADRDGNVNNYLTRADLVKPAFGTSPSPFISTVSPDSSTVAMAGKKNKSKKGSAAKQQPTSTPPTEPTAAGSSAVREGSSPVRDALRSSSPSKPRDTTATPTVGPGGFPDTPASEEDKTFGINPMPAAPGAVNPIQLAPGEKIPESISGKGINDHVKLDEDSYNRSDAIPGTDFQSQLPPVSKNMIPESSLPMGNGQEANINTVGPSSTTAALAGAVPRETAVPDMVKKSQDKAGFAPEASAVPEEVREKSEVEKELQDKVQKAPTTSEGTAGSDFHKAEHKGQAAGAAALAAGAAGVATTAAKHHSSDKTASAGNDFRSDATSAGNDLRSGATNTANDLSESAKQKAPEPTHGALVTGQTKDDAQNRASSAGPGEVRDSAFGTHKSPEVAATSSSALSKQPTEPELAKDVERAPAVDQAATHDSRPTETKPEASKSLGTSAFGAHDSTSDVHVAKPTQSQASELPTHEPKSEVAQGAEAKVAEATAADTKPAESKAEQSTPEAIKLTESQAAESTPEPTKHQETSPETTGNSAEATPEKKKKNRLSTIFTKIKEKLADKK